jgi:predicted Zn-dependent peptidase
MIALRANNAILQTAVDEQKKTIDAINAFDKAQAARINELQSNLSAAEDERKKLEDQFAQQNLNEGAIKDPKAIEDIINQTTADQFKQIEADTGAKSTTTPPVKKPACSAHLPAVLCKSK